jgi:hypothetical protein
MQQHLEHDVSRPLEGDSKDLFLPQIYPNWIEEPWLSQAHSVEGWQPWGRGRVGEDNQGRYPARTILCLSIIPIALVYDVVSRHHLVFLFTFTGSPRLRTRLKVTFPQPLLLSNLKTQHYYLIKQYSNQQSPCAYQLSSPWLVPLWHSCSPCSAYSPVISLALWKNITL